MKTLNFKVGQTVKVYNMWTKRYSNKTIAIISDLGAWFLTEEGGKKFYFEDVKR